MRGILGILGVLVLVVLSGPVSAAVVSANGFTCTATPSSAGQLVECTGSFPGVNGLFGATGRELVQIEYSPDNKRRFYYMSDTGCLILNAGDNTAMAADRGGNKKTFGAFMDAMGWCYQGGAGTAPSQGVQKDQKGPPMK